MSDPIPSPADDVETGTEDRLEQLEPADGATTLEAVLGDGAFAGPGAEERAVDERLEEDGRTTGE